MDIVINSNPTTDKDCFHVERNSFNLQFSENTMYKNCYKHLEAYRIWGQVLTILQSACAHQKTWNM